MKTFLLVIIPFILFAGLILVFGQVSQEVGYNKAKVECVQEKVKVLISSDEVSKQEEKKRAKIYVSTNRNRDDVLKLMRGGLY